MRNQADGHGSPARPAARAFWQNVAIPKSRDISLLRPSTLPRGERFETLTDAARIDDANIARLLNPRPDLAAEIERCHEEGERATLPVSARAARRYRRYFTAELLRVAQEHEGPHQIATIYLRPFRPGELQAAELKLAHKALRKTLQRSGFGGSTLVGGTEIAWLTSHNLWILHCHLLAIGVLQADWNRLRQSLPDAKPATALKVQALQDFPEQVSYCQKFNSSHKPGKRGPDGRGVYPLSTERLIEWAEWMAKQRFEDFAFLFVLVVERAELLSKVDAFGPRRRTRWRAVAVWRAGCGFPRGSLSSSSTYLSLFAELPVRATPLRSGSALR